MYDYGVLHRNEGDFVREIANKYGIGEWTGREIRNLDNYNNKFFRRLITNGIFIKIGRKYNGNRISNCYKLHSDMFNRVMNEG